MEKALREAYKNYISFLEYECSRFAGLAFAHGMEVPKESVKKGCIHRDAISAAESALEHSGWQKSKGCLFDYKALPGCQYGLPSSDGPDYVSDCEDPSVALIWWDIEENGMRVCQRHLEEIEKSEEEKDGGQPLPEVPQP